MKLGLTGYIIPFMFVFGPSLLMIGSWQRIATTSVTAIIGVTLLSGGLSGFLLKPATRLNRLVFIAAAFTLIKPGLATDAVGLALAVLGVAMNVRWPAPWRVPDQGTSAEPMGPLEAPSHAPIEPADYNEAPAAHVPPRGARG